MITPWHDRALELEPEHGAYCMYAAWEEWIAAHDDHDVFANLDGMDKVFLFSLFERACEETMANDNPIIL